MDKVDNVKLLLPLLTVAQALHIFPVIYLHLWYYVYPDPKKQSSYSPQVTFFGVAHYCHATVSKLINVSVYVS